MNPPTLFDVAVRDTDPDTGHAAAHTDRTSIENRACEIIRAAGWHGATCDDVHAVFEAEGWSHKWGSTSRRITTLAKDGRIVLAGTRVAGSGRSQRVWRAANCMAVAS